MINKDKMKVFADKFNDEIYPVIEKLGIDNLEKHVEKRKREVEEQKSTIIDDDFSKEELEIIINRAKDSEDRFVPLEALEFLNDLDIDEIEEMFNSLEEEG